jgi:hypothetical protein
MWDNPDAMIGAVRALLDKVDQGQGGWAFRSLDQLGRVLEQDPFSLRGSR